MKANLQELRGQVFEMGAGDPTDFVRKAGDTMTGRLTITVNDGNAAYIRSGTTGGTSIFYVRNGNERTNFRVMGNGGVQAGPDAENPFIASVPHDVTTKKYVDDAIAARAARQPDGPRFKYQNPQGDPSKAVNGLIYKSSSSTTSGTLYVSRYDLDGLYDLNVFYGDAHPDSAAAAIPGLEMELPSDDPVPTSSSREWDLGLGLPLSFYQKSNDGRWQLLKTFNITKLMMLTSTSPLYLTYNKETRWGDAYYTYTILTLPGFF